MILDLVRSKDKREPAIADPTAIEHARLWHCTFTTLSWLRQLTRLRTLVIATLPDPNLDFIAAMPRLEYLSVLHLPRLETVQPLAGLNALRVVRLSTLPSWDASGKTTEISSLAPLTALPRLGHLELFGVRPPSRSLAELETSVSLRTVRVSKYPRAEVARFRAATGWCDDFAPLPSVAGWH